MSLFRPIKTSRVADQPLRLWETGPANTDFEPAWLPQETTPTRLRRFPRDWMEVETIVEERIRQFEDRHRAECDAAFERGVQEGMRRREEETQRKLNAAREPLAKVAAAAEQELATIRNSIYDQVTKLTAALTDALLRRVVAINPVAFTAALHDALEPLAHLDHVTVRLNPADARALQDGIGSGAEEFLQFANLKIVADPKVSPGGAVTESEGGSVDCRLETRLDQALGIIHAADS